MASIEEQYVREIHDDLGFWAAWLPGDQVKLGDCGTVDKFAFNRRTSLKTLGVDFDVRKLGGPGDLSHQSQKGVTIDFQAAGENRDLPGLPAGKVGASMSFSKDNSVVFVAKGCKSTAIDEIDALARDLKQKYKEKVFPAQYVVVTQVVAAESATIVIGRTANATLTLEAGADVGVAGVADLASVDAKFSVKRSVGLATQYVAEAGLTPLFRVMGFQRNWFNGMPTDEFEEMGADEADYPADEVELVDADFDEYARAQ